MPDPEGHGWMLDEDGTLNINWMTGAPAPEAVFELLSCSCAKLCKIPTCTYIANNLKCTSACRLSNCENSAEEEESMTNLDFSESSESDEDYY